MASLADKLVFPAPKPSYSKESFKNHLCWIPWNKALSPDKVDDEVYAEGIPCMWLPAERAAGVILFFHGNAEDLGLSHAFVQHMRDQFKMNVLAVEYPGYGLLKNIASSEKSVQEVVLTVFRFVVDELRVAYEQIFLFGRSIGSGPATYLASTFPVGGLILVAAFASINEVIRSLAGSIIARAFVERFPNISLIGNVSCPTLFIHGEKDSLVPPEQSVALFKQCRARKLLITPPGLEHNTNLWSDASFLAVPAINFFGLPGYQQETPVTMPTHVYEDGRRQFLLRKASKRREGKENEDKQTDGGSPWFLFCGCPTNKGRAKTGGGSMIGHEPHMDSRDYEWTPDGTHAPNNLMTLLEARRNNSRAGSPNSAARDTHAAKLGRLSEERSNSRTQPTWLVP
jgi:pimeloyl-ACP methyl ester carboxylesterase